MLDVGRRESERAGILSTGIEVAPRSLGGHQPQGKSNAGSTKENSSDREDQNRMLPLPGYLNNPSSHAAVIGGGTDISKEHAVVQAAKESTGSDANSLEDVNRMYSFLSIFGNNEEDSETDDVVLSPHGPSDDEDDAVQHPDGEVISNFMTMFSKSSDSHESNAAGSQAGQSRPSSPDGRPTACSEANTPCSPESISSGRKSVTGSASSPRRNSATSSTESTSGGKSTTGSTSSPTRNSATSLTTSQWV
jgi:hypothetical protein